eukprot:6209396-Pleurochrysis_carterae.AAC.3
MANHTTIQLTMVRERAQARGLGAPKWAALGPGRSLGSAGHARAVIQNLGRGARSAERSARSHATQVQIGKMCMRAKRSSALPRFNIL